MSKKTRENALDSTKMSSSLLNAELYSELKSLDQRYGNNESELPKAAKKLRNSFKKKYKSNPEVEKLAQAIRVSDTEVKAKRNKVVEQNVQRLLKSSKTKSVDYR